MVYDTARRGTARSRMQWYLLERRKSRQRVRKRKTERKRWWRRHYKRAAWKKFGRLRLATACFLLICVLYLCAAGHFKERLFQVREEISLEVRDDHPGFRERFWRIVFRLKTGEVVIYREEELKKGPEEEP